MASKVRSFFAKLSDVIISTPAGVSMISQIEDFISDIDRWDKWPQGIRTVYDAYKNIGIVRQSINTLAHFATRNSFMIDVVPIRGESKEEDILKIRQAVTDINRKVNADLTWFIATIKREIWGRAAFEIVRDENGSIVMLLPLVSSAIQPVIEPETMMVDYYRYGSEDLQLDPEDVIYFSKDALEWDRLGISSIETIKRNINIKVNLERDLREASKRLWAPIGLFEMDTSYVPGGSAAKKQEMQAFSDQLKPGRSLVYNKKIKPTIINMQPNISDLVKALEKQDEEIMGNWNIPKALLSREKTLTKATLEYSLKALYEGPVAGLQRYFKGEIEMQLYDRILFDLHMEDKYRVRHVWRPTVIHDPQLIRALAYAVDRGAMTKSEMFNVLGWEILEKEKESKPRGLVRLVEDKIEERIDDVLADREVTPETVEDLVKGIGGGTE